MNSSIRFFLALALKEQTQQAADAAQAAADAAKAKMDDDSSKK